MRDLDFSPDGSYFVITTTGAYGGSDTACDTSARFETDETGTEVAPSWINTTGGDTTYAVEITDSVVYVGGHQRWQNNPFAADRVGQGAISRPGIAALDPVNGLPFSWNPTRTRGVGLFDFLLTEQGLWASSDTDRIGNYEYHGRIALMPADGKQLLRIVSPTIPNDVYLAGGAGDAMLTNRHYVDGDIGGVSEAPNGDLNWDQVRGTFMVNGELFTAWADGSFSRQSFDGSQFGTPEPVDTSDQLAVLTNWRNDISQASGMFYDNGRVYFTLSGSDKLYYRYLTTESDVVGAKRYVASNSVAGIDFSNVRGMFAVDRELYWATPSGALNRIDWENRAQSLAPVPDTAETVSGPEVDGNTWDARDMFLFQDAEGNAAPQPPKASFTSDCTSLTCVFDASASTADGAAITSYAWDFDDGSNGTGETPTHDFQAEGTYNVTLTITTDAGGQESTSNEVVVERVNEAPVAAFTAVCDGLECSFDASGSTDDEGIVSYAWDFGDGDADTGETATHTYSEAGDFTVELTVTDGEGETNSTTRVAYASTLSVGFVAADSTNGNRLQHSVQIPDEVEAGDALLLFLTANSDSVAVAGPEGWTELESRASGNMSARLWSRTATAGDAGSTVVVDTSGRTKSDLSVAAYRGQGGDASVATTASEIAGVGTSHTTPSVDVTEGGSSLVSYWGGKSGSITAWSLAAGQVERTGSVGVLGGHVTAVLADSDGPVASGATGGVTAVADADARAALFSVVVSAQAAPPPVNEAPVAAFTAVCDGLECSFDASGSTDDEGIVSYAWDFGDGDADTGETATHTYSEAGDFTVELTVTDGEGETNSTTRVAYASTLSVGFVAADSTNGNRLQHSVQIPDEVEAGDALLLFLTANSDSVAVAGPEGWTELESRASGNMSARLWSRTATAGDAGSTVVVDTSGRTKSDLSVAAYRGQGGDASVATTASEIAGVGTSHTTPSVDVTEGGSSLVSYWGGKSGSITAWSLAAGQVERTGSVGVLGGHVTAVLADSDGPVASGATGGVTAVADADARAALFSVVVSAQAAPPPVNEAPVAAFTAVCDGLECSFDASGSTDDEGIVSYAWDFGDGDADTGETATHTYSEAGDFTVELTVTDGEGETNSTTRVAYASTLSVGFVAADSTNGNRLQHSVQIPNEVEAGDALLLFLTANADSVTVAGPEGWTELESRASGNMSARLWSRTATAGDAGSTVVVDTSGRTKSDLSVAAYRGQGGDASVATTASEIAGVGTSHTTPSVDVTEGGSSLVSYWGGKSGSITAWSLAAGQVERTGSVGVLGGHVTAVLADSDGPVASGATGGVTAVADADARAALFSVVVSAQGE